jgi:isochorismate synthase EntC
VLHSGAGIVSGSNPDDELEETIWKLKPMLDALSLSIS